MQKKQPEKYECYDGELGAVYTREQTIFRLWAPTAEKVELLLYADGAGGVPQHRERMEKAEGGTWLFCAKGDRNGTYYTYLVAIDGEERESADPYAKAAGVNGVRSMVVDLAGTDPLDFEKDREPKLGNPTQAVICEISVRDITEHASWGGNPGMRGRFLGAVEPGTRNSAGMATGFDYIRELGVTHVQIMPFFDFCSIDEADQSGRQYNWGYDPLNYNLPEGSYASDPFHGQVRIRECKEMIAAFHRAGIGVIMDVVYNHTFDVGNSCLQKCVPDYFYRKKKGIYTNGSGCGNEIASERPMVRKYIVDSLKYWVEEYHVDGFRFDLMGVLDITTMRLVKKELTRLNPSILLYGEGWTGGESALTPGRRAHKGNAPRLKGIAMFSDDFRDAVKGNVFEHTAGGFVNGRPEKGRELRPWIQNPTDVVNYLSCHDNLTLWDKLKMTLPGKSTEERIAVNCLAAAILFTSQGIPLFMAGEDFARSKPLPAGVFSDNSYNLPPEVNAMNYDRLGEYRKLHEYYKGLIAFRKAHGLLQLAKEEEVREQLKFEDTEDGILRYELWDGKERILVIHNATERTYRFSVKKGMEYGVFVDAETAGTEVLYTISGSASVKPHSSLVAISPVLSD